jgi:protein-S-isoprenylcysteine O-methyltransferase Ste14
MLEHKIPPPVVGLALAAGMAWLASVTPVVAAPVGLRWGLAAALAGLGLSFDVRGLLAFRRARTTVNPLRPQRASHLVTEGVYQTTRNPMYVGMAILLLAVAVALAAPVALLGPVLFVLYITRFQIQPEERALRALFGADFEAYCAKVPRWL